MARFHRCPVLPVAAIVALAAALTPQALPSQTPAHGRPGPPGGQPRPGLHADRARAIRSCAPGLLADDRWLTALRSGLPVRLHYRVEVWRRETGWFDLLARQTEWDVVVRHEPLLDQYTLLTVAGNGCRNAAMPRSTRLSAALAFAYQVNVRPGSGAVLLRRVAGGVDAVRLGPG